MWKSRILLGTALLTLAFPLSSQDDRTAYFSLSTARTFAPEETPKISLWTQNVEALNFRVYRVKDPVLFFQKLDDVHQFGGRAPQMPGSPTLVERLYYFKQDLRRWFRNLVRAQFSGSSRAKIRNWREGKQETSEGTDTEVASFAEVPLLNQEQLVSSWTERISHRRNWGSSTVSVKVKGKGLYLVEAVHKDLRAYTIVLVTGLVVITKSAPGHVLAYVVDRTQGTPIPGATVHILSSKKEVARVETDAQGLAEVRLEETKPEDPMVMVRTADDFAVDSLYSWYLNSDPDKYWVGYIYSDRPVYRPGHQVRFKGILRTQVGAAYRLPEMETVQVEVQDPEGKPVFRKTIDFSRVGTIQGEFTLSVAAVLGYYSINVRAGPDMEGTLEGGFHVEEYKKPEYKVEVQPTQTRVLQGDAIRATIQADYYFGEPVKNAKVTYVVHRSRYWFPLYADEDEWENEGEGGDYYDYGSDQVLEKEGTLDAEGKLQIRIPTAVSDRKWDMRYRIEARVRDEGNREIVGFRSVLATYGNFVLNVEPDRYVYEPGQAAGITIEARDYRSNPVETLVRVELAKWSWREKSRQRPLVTMQTRTNANGIAKVRLPLREQGSFRVRVIASAAKGREIEDSGYLWVAGAGRAWYGGSRERVDIIPDKKSYKPGDVAKVLIVTGKPAAHLLVTTEGREIHSHRTLVATGPTLTIEVPIRAEYAPNFFLGVAFVLENELFAGTKKIKVPPVEQQLNVEVRSSKQVYKPQEPAVFTVTAKDHRGRPVAAEFSLGVVDESVYAIRPEAAQNIVKFFYGSVGNRVDTDSSFSYYFHGASGKKSMELARNLSEAVMLRAGDLVQLKEAEAPLVEPQIRKAFPDTILWLGAVTTDARGRATARVTLPDALTTWRATARGVTGDTKVGSAVHRAVTRKNLILRLSVPRFFTEGDEVTISALIHNYLKTAKTAHVSLETEGLTIIEGQKQEVRVPSQGEARVDFRVRAGKFRQAKLLGKVLTDEESDALELTLPIVPYGVKLAQAQSGSLSEPAEETTVALTFPGEIEPSSRSMEIRVTPSVAGAIFGALEFLTTFPYGCTEQTMSSFLPNIIVAQAMKDLNVKSNVDPGRLEKKIRQGLDRLYDFQHSDGGWGWWKTDESHAFMTAYVISGLAEARAAGYEIQEDVIDNGRRWLEKEFPQTQRVTPDLRAYMAYALIVSQANSVAEQAGDESEETSSATSSMTSSVTAPPVNLKSINEVWGQRSELTPYGLALLGLALQRAGDARAEEIAEALEKEAEREEHQAYWKVERDTLMNFSGDTSPEATAHALKFLAQMRPNSPLLPKAALWLVNHRD
ncbi:MAG: MG2 domain-containing protein, partial [Acidobacteria bacterium]|nr:MG2 domain-containing protein [Acidobacteriota bacterium]